MRRFLLRNCPRLGQTAYMNSPIRRLLEQSPAFRQAMLKSETRRIVGVISFVLFFAVLAMVRIFAMGSAMSRWGLVAAALMIAFELLLLRLYTGRCGPMDGSRRSFGTPALRWKPSFRPWASPSLRAAAYCLPIVRWLPRGCWLSSRSFCCRFCG